LPAAAATQLKGMIGQGNSSGVALKGKPSAGKTEVPQEEVIATYRRQAEQELNTERVPEALKETIKKYFLSLDTQQRNGDPAK
jgi:anti-sigma28 factor (negative regulator of flagellin synthesis)